MSAQRACQQTEFITRRESCIDINSVCNPIKTIAIYGNRIKNDKVNNFDPDQDRSEKPDYCDRRGFMRSMPGNWAYPEEWY